ncbi:MAG: prepilin-type N-terminal cleavage/methylation domain-containing protein, partial [Xanthomonadales bacterium]|nr:prepilin-type N-terminal cleavage/methylation domain-containing protein [Xanthomonadales bacterium]
MNFRNRAAQSGFSLLELSLATAIYSMGLGGLSLLMFAAVQGTADARHQTVAVAEASSLAETILMNPAAFGHYIEPPAAADRD